MLTSIIGSCRPPTASIGTPPRPTWPASPTRRTRRRRSRPKPLGTPAPWRTPADGTEAAAQAGGPMLPRRTRTQRGQRRGRRRRRGRWRRRRKRQRRSRRRAGARRSGARTRGLHRPQGRPSGVGGRPSGTAVPIGPHRPLGRRWPQGRPRPQRGRGGAHRPQGLAKRLGTSRARAPQGARSATPNGPPPSANSRRALVAARSSRATSFAHGTFFSRLLGRRVGSAEWSGRLVEIARDCPTARPHHEQAQRASQKQAARIAQAHRAKSRASAQSQTSTQSQASKQTKHRSWAIAGRQSLRHGRTSLGQQDSQAHYAVERAVQQARHRY